MKKIFFLILLISWRNVVFSQNFLSQFSGMHNINRLYYNSTTNGEQKKKVILENIRTFTLANDSLYFSRNIPIEGMEQIDFPIHISYKSIRELGDTTISFTPLKNVPFDDIVCSTDDKILGIKYVMVERKLEYWLYRNYSYHQIKTINNTRVKNWYDSDHIVCQSNDSLLLYSISEDKLKLVCKIDSNTIVKKALKIELSSVVLLVESISERIYKVYLFNGKELKKIISNKNPISVLADKSSFVIVSSKRKKLIVEKYNRYGKKVARIDLFKGLKRKPLRYQVCTSNNTIDFGFIVSFSDYAYKYEEVDESGTFLINMDDIRKKSKITGSYVGDEIYMLPNKCGEK
ncbi:MAG: hypothetical protein HYV28_03145 [Ignavibacteriales bacterium]|nr:hypothetical protein [Ignavibacteriales bacterium]